MRYQAEPRNEVGTQKNRLPTVGPKTDRDNRFQWFRSFGGKMEPLGETHEDWRATAQAVDAPGEP